MTKTVAELIDEINTQLPTNNSRAISAAVLRPVLIDMVSNNQITLVGGNTAILSDTRSFAQGTIFPSVAGGGPTYVRTAGFAVVGDSGDGLYIRLASDPGSANPGYFQSLDGAWWGLVAEDGEFHVEQFGGNADFDPLDPGGPHTDNLAPMNSAITYVTAIFDPSFAFYKSGPKITLQYGMYYFSDTIVPDRTIVIEGLGNGRNNGGWQTAVFVAAGKSFIRIIGYTTPGPVPGAAFTTVKHLKITSLGDGGETTKHGIDAQCQFAVEDCSVGGFGGHGISLIADTGGGGGSNGNLSTVIGCWGTDNIGSGFYCQGGDTNACYIEQFNGSSNARYGIEDISFLGNTYIACHSADNTLGAYYSTGPNANTVFIGCYSETGQLPARFDRLTMVVGGAHGAGISGSSLNYSSVGLPPIPVAGEALDVPFLGFGLRSGPGGFNTLLSLTNPGSTYRINHGGGYGIGATSIALDDGTATIGIGATVYIPGVNLHGYTVTAGTIGPGTITITPGLIEAVADQSYVELNALQGFSLDWRFDNATRSYVWQWANVGNFGEYFTTELSTFTCGRSTTVATNNNIFSKGLFIGDPVGNQPNSARCLGFGSGAPVSGAYARGDKIFDNAPVAGGTEGWVCVTAGSPGTWKTFGSIAV